MVLLKVKVATLFVVLFCIWRTQEIMGQVVINEVMANVKGTESGAGSPGDRNEFVELLNLSPDTVDVNGWFLDDGDARDVLRVWTDTRINDPDVIMNTTLLPPGSYAVILDPEYPDSGDGNFIQPYDFPPNTILLTVGNTTLGDGLATTDPLSLFNQDTLLIDTYGTPSDTLDSIPSDPGDGISVERIDSALPDLESNWLPSIDPTGSTPGRENSVSVGVWEEIEKFTPESSSGQNIKLFQNQPNPFHSNTLIRYQIPEGVGTRRAVSLRLAIYDITGRLVETLVNQVQESGVYRVQWGPFVGANGRSPLPSGVYFYRLTVGAQNFEPLPSESRQGSNGQSPYIATQKMILLR